MSFSSYSYIKEYIFSAYLYIIITLFYVIAIFYYYCCYNENTVTLRNSAPWSDEDQEGI